MNVPVPLQDEPYGFLIIIVLSLIVSSLLAVAINRKGWL
jgi:magnesium transporter